MFETSPLKLRNRRSFAVLEHLGETAGTGIVLAGNFQSLPSNFTRAQRAMALAEAAEDALALAVETAAAPSGRSGRGATRVWKHMTPAKGAEAVIFLAHG